MKTIDVRGLSCPEPVMRVQEGIEQGEFFILANEAHTVKNISRFLDSKKRKYEIKELGDEYEISVK